MTVVVQRILYECEHGTHTLCHGWRHTYGARPEDDFYTVCSCGCGHPVAKAEIASGVLRVPEGVTLP